MCPDTGSLESPSRNPLTQEMECSLTSPSRTFPASRTSNSLCTRIWPSSLSLATFYSIWGPEQAHTALPLPTVGGQAGPTPGSPHPAAQAGARCCHLCSPQVNLLKCPLLRLVGGQESTIQPMKRGRRESAGLTILPTPQSPSLSSACIRPRGGDTPLLG